MSAIDPATYTTFENSLFRCAASETFLERFYGDREGYASQTQRFFLFQRLAQVRTLAQPGMFAHCVVSDFTFAKDAIYARVNLGDEEYHHYAQMWTIPSRNSARRQTLGAPRTIGPVSTAS